MLHSQWRVIKKILTSDSNSRESVSRNLLLQHDRSMIEISRPNKNVFIVILMIPLDGINELIVEDIIKKKICALIFQSWPWTRRGNLNIEIMKVCRSNKFDIYFIELRAKSYFIDFTLVKTNIYISI